jgi:hypothetical protein
MTNRSGLTRGLAICHLSYLICHFSFGNCLPAATPDPEAVAAARAEIRAFEPFLREPLCEQIAVKYQLSTDQATIGNLDKTIELAEEVAQADQGFDFPIDGIFKPLANCPDFIRIADRVRAQHPQVHRSVSAFTIDDQMLIPEGLAYDSRTQSFLMGSINKKKIGKGNSQSLCHQEGTD